MRRFKHCHVCNTTKLIKEFNNHGDTYDGKQTFCRNCQNKCNLKRYYERKAAK